MDGGTLTGTGALYLPNEGLPFANGELELEELQFYHKASQTTGFIPLTTSSWPAAWKKQALVP